MMRAASVSLLLGGLLILTSSIAVAEEPTTNLPARLKEERARLAGIKSSISANPQFAGDDYVQLGIVVAERFVRRIETNGSDKESLAWSWLQINEIKEVLDRTEARIKGTVAGKFVPQPIPRPAGGPVTVRDGTFYTDTTTGKGSPLVQRPCYFAGYGVFAQVAADIPNFRQFGTTLVSQERGPNSMNPDGSLNEGGRSLLKTLKSAAASGIKVDLLLSPHYYPQWAIDQAPDAGGIMLPKDPKDYFGFPNLHFDHPKAREVIQKWLETIVAAVKDEPALFSLCLANEPENHNGGRDPWSRPRWIEYLKQHHQTIGSLNALYGTNYKAFEDVPPGTQAITDVGSRRAYYDWVRFNQQHFAEWFQWMNGIVKKSAPGVLTHIKTLSSHFLYRLVGHGVDPELLCRITDLAGNDCVAQPGARESVPSPLSLEWEEFWYDLLHSFRGQPSFNSENHFIIDDSPAVTIPSNHTRSVLWQGALHHQGATTLWVWEEPVLAQLKGSIYLRPSSVYSAGQTMLDLNRLALEVAAINQAKPKVALLYSMPSYIWQGGWEVPTEYLGVMKRVHEALNFIGQPVTFVSELQLAEGSAAAVDWIIVPRATHVQASTVTALEKFVAKGGRVAMVGKDCLRWDEYQRERSLPQVLGAVAQLDSAADDRQLAASLHKILADGGLKLTPLQNVDERKPAWGVEYRAVPHQDCVLVPMISFLQQPQRVRLLLPGSATDLLSGEAVNLEDIRLEPMQPRLLRVARTVEKR